MIAAPPAPLLLRSDGQGRVYLTEAAWPAHLRITDELIRASGRLRLVVHYPWLVFRLDNAHAVYRLGTCDRGVWDATLVEGATWA